MSDALLTILKWCLLALIYLFFFRVLQATWSGSTTTVAVRRPNGRRSGGATRPESAVSVAGGPGNAPAPDAARGRRDGASTGHLHGRETHVAPRAGLVSLTVLEPQADAGRRIDVTGELTIGRAAGCQVVFDDTFISQLHAKVTPVGDGVMVEDLGSTNGTYVNQQRVVVPVLAGPGDRLQFGGVVMEFR